MVCPNCHSDRIIAVQDQHFCINCGQQVPESSVTAEKTPVAVGENGLPEGVKILPLTPGDKTSLELSMDEDSKASSKSEPKVSAKTLKSPKSKAKAAAATESSATPVNTPITSSESAEPVAIINHRTRILSGAPVAQSELATNEAATPTPDPVAVKEPAGKESTTSKAKKRKPGRPKAGRLDVPRSIGTTVFASTATMAPGTMAMSGPITKYTDVVAPGSLAPTAGTVSTERPAPAVPITQPAGPRRLSDIAPRRATTKSDNEVADTDADSKKASSKRGHKAKKQHVHKVGVPPLHYGHVLAFSARARFHQGAMLLGSLAAGGFAFVAGYLAWLFLDGGLPDLAQTLLHPTALMFGEAILLAAIYYIGRSVGQGAIVFGAVREADARSVNLAKQLAVGVNTFGRRLRLDIAFGLAEATLITIIAVALLRGGGTWPIDPQLQLAALFIGFLVILYVLTGLALTRGLAGVALTISTQTPWQAAKLGWRMFSHRFELLSMRFVATILEVVLAVPLAALAIGFMLTTPAEWHIPVVIGVGLLAWLAGALIGAGTAAWWAALYRRIVQVDHPADETKLLSGYPAGPVRAGALTVIVALSSFLIAAALALPWLKIF